jgi:peptide/nickel transport system substrate-binding protein
MFKKIFAAFTSEERRAFLITVAVFILGVTALGGLVFGTKTKVVPAQGGDYTEGFVGQPSFIEPVFASTEVDRSLVRLLFANVNVLAEKIDMDENGRVWRVRLKEHLTWSDGHKLTSDDLIFTIEKIQEAGDASPLARSWRGVVPNRLSELEVQFTLGAPHPTFNENLRAFYPVPKHLFAEIPTANWRLSDYNLKPVGSGPYVFKGFEKQSTGFLGSYRLEANPNYAGDRANIAVFTIDFFPNLEQLIAAWNGGAIDGMALKDPESLKEIKRPYQSVAYRLPSYYAVFFNQSQNVALKDPSVREALSLSAPRETLVKEVFGGYAQSANSPIPPGIFSNIRLDAPTGDPSALLDNAGWRMGSSSIREKTVKSVKIPLEFSLTIPNVPFLVRTAETLASAWRAIGANVEIRTVPFGDAFSQIIKNREYQAILYGNTLNPPFNLYPFWSSNERFSPGLNLALYSNKKVDALLESIAKNGDATKQEEILADTARAIVADFPAVFLYSPDYLYLADKNLKGLIPSLIREPADRFLEAHNWYLKTEWEWE